MKPATLKIVIALLLALAAAAGAVFMHQRAASRQALHLQLEAVDALHQRQTASADAFKARVAAFRLDHQLTAQRLTSPASLRQGRESVAQYRQLAAERVRLFDESAAQSRALLVAQPRGRLRHDGLLGQVLAPSGGAEVRRRLSIAMAANADAVQAVYDWAASHQGHLRAEGDKLLIDSQPLIAALDALQYTVNDTSRAVGEAEAAVATLEAGAAQALATLHREVDG